MANSLILGSPINPEGEMMIQFSNNHDNNIGKIQFYLSFEL